MWTEWEKSLSQQEKDAFFDWTYNRYSEINSYLFGNYHSEDRAEILKEQVACLDIALGKFALPKDFYAYRCEIRDISADDFQYFRSVELKYPNYIATSLSKNSMFDHLIFLCDNSTRGIRILMNLTISQGINCGNLENMSFHPDEREILVARNNKIIINQGKLIIENGSELVVLEGTIVNI